MQAKKRSNSKSGRSPQYPLQTDPVIKQEPNQQQKQSQKKPLFKSKEKISRQLNFDKSFLNLKVQYERIIKQAQTAFSHVSKLKPFLVLKSQESKQIYSEFKTYRSVLMSQMKLFQQNVSGLGDYFRRHPKAREQELGNNEYFMEETKTKIRNQQKVTESPSCASKQEYDLLKSELFDLQNICQAALHRKNILDQELVFQQSQISKYRQLLKLAISPSVHLLKYFDYISQYKQQKLGQEAEDYANCSSIQENINVQERNLKNQIMNNKSFQEQLILNNKQKSQQLKQLTSFVETIKDNLNQINQEYNKIKQSLIQNKDQMMNLLKILGITNQSSNFFNNFILCSRKIKQLNQYVQPQNKLSFYDGITKIVESLKQQITKNDNLQQRINEKQKLLSEAAEEYQTVTASYIKVNNQHIDLIKSYKLVSSKVQILENHNIEFTKLIRRIDQISEDQSQQDEKQQQINLICQQTIVKQLRKSQQQIKCKFFALKQQYKISQNLISQYKKQIQQKNEHIHGIQSELYVLKQQLDKSKGQSTILLKRIQIQKQQTISLETKVSSLQYSPVVMSRQRLQLLQHITSQQSEINRLAYELNISKQSMSVLQYQYSVLFTNLQNTKAHLESQQSVNKELMTKISYLQAMINEQQFQISTLTQRLNNKITQTQIFQEKLKQTKLNQRLVQNQNRVIKSQTQKYQNMLSDKDHQIVKKSRQIDKLELEIRQKDSTIRQNYLTINKLKQEMQFLQTNQKTSKITLLDQLKQIIVLQSSVHFKVPILQFIQLQESQNLPLFVSEREESNPFESNPSENEDEENKNYTRLLLDLSSDSHSQDHKLDHHLQNFSSKKRIQQLKASVSNQLQVPIQKQKIFSTKKISEILIQKPFNQNVNFDEVIL